MTVELIPVIEIGYNNQDIPTPDKFPYWNHPELWDKYNNDSYKKAGFTDDLKPYLAGSSFYRLSEITDNNLKKLIIDHTQELRDGKYEREQASALFAVTFLVLTDKTNTIHNVVATLLIFSIGKILRKEKKVVFMRDTQNRK